MNENNPNFVSKQKKSVTITLAKVRVVGTIHVLYNHRALDVMNENIKFIPVTEVEVYAIDTNNLLLKTDFIAINKEHVVYIQEND